MKNFPITHQAGSECNVQSLVINLSEWAREKMLWCSRKREENNAIIQQIFHLDLDIPLRETNEAH